MAKSTNSTKRTKPKARKASRPSQASKARKTGSARNAGKSGKSGKLGKSGKPSQRTPRASNDNARARTSRAVWSGSISFGLLQIPITLHSAIASHDLSFRQLDKHDLSPIGYQRINKITGKQVAWTDIVKGYEIDKGRFVEVPDDDFRKANVEATQTIDIQDFVEQASIDLRYFETPYYLAPARRAAKAYGLLREALRRSRRAAVATFVLHTREHLAAIVPLDAALVLYVLRFAHELRSPDDLPLPEGGLRTSKRELDMAVNLIEQMSGAWAPEQYKDTYRDELMAAIAQKARTGRVKAMHEPKRAREESNVVDLMSVLRKSLSQAQARKTAHAQGRR